LTYTGRVWAPVFFIFSNLAQQNTWRSARSALLTILLSF